VSISGGRSVRPIFRARERLHPAATRWHKRWASVSVMESNKVTTTDGRWRRVSQGCHNPAGDTGSPRDRRWAVRLRHGRGVFLKTRQYSCWMDTSSMWPYIMRSELQLCCILMMTDRNCPSLPSRLSTSRTMGV